MVFKSKAKLDPILGKKGINILKLMKVKKKIQCTQNTQGLLSTVHTITHTH